MNKRIVVILAHPSSESLNAALAQRYVTAAQKAGAEVIVIKLGELNFDPVLREGYKSGQEFEPDLLDAQKKIDRAEHLVIFTPMWWGTTPAIFKGFIDRVFLPGWAFTYKDNRPVQLLKGRTAQVVATMDCPGFWYRLVYRNSMQRTLGTATLRFCGFRTQFKMLFGVRESSQAERAKWLSQVETMATRQAREPRAQSYQSTTRLVFFV